MYNLATSSPLVEPLRLKVQEASQFLKEDLSDITTKHYCCMVFDYLIKELDTHKSRLYMLKDDLEKLATLILFRVTTRLGSIKLMELYDLAREVLKRLKSLTLPRALQDGICEFLITPSHCFSVEKLDEDIELLSHQITFLQKMIQNGKLKEKEQYVIPHQGLIMTREEIEPS